MGKRTLFLVVACAAILLTVGLVRGAEPGHDKTITAATIAPASTVAARGKITIDGRKEDVHGSCYATADGRSVNISLSGATPTKTNVRLDNAQPPNVASVVLATSTMAFLYQPGTEGSAQATNDGNTYHITGTLLRYGFVSKAFEIAVTCS
ncbi:lipoprotein LpqH [Mycolicibacterium moriokaense]|uniref:Lipoprotein antigen n=1 Tax=Mycolicibacterium moriokaense TaxID=39691 RepID=A0A318HK60_9MYCO|nr:lipoprotein LpqH [Mycolicibacterium moriokaense]PXX06348.1 lipoprotein antigen [Mycolicibacterium moriokaense]